MEDDSLEMAMVNDNEGWLQKNEQGSNVLYERRTVNKTRHLKEKETEFCSIPYLL